MAVAVASLTLGGFSFAIRRSFRACYGVTEVIVGVKRCWQQLLLRKRYEGFQTGNICPKIHEIL
jgi:hypothetical protein